MELTSSIAAGILYLALALGEQEQVAVTVTEAKAEFGITEVRSILSISLTVKQIVLMGFD